MVVGGTGLFLLAPKEMKADSSLLQTLFGKGCSTRVKGPAGGHPLLGG